MGDVTNLFLMHGVVSVSLLNNSIHNDTKAVLILQNFNTKPMFLTTSPCQKVYIVPTKKQAKNRKAIN